MTDWSGEQVKELVDRELTQIRREVGDLRRENSELRRLVYMGVGIAAVIAIAAELLLKR